MSFLAVFLTILKVAGIAIGIIVGLVVLFICWFLFIPVRYKGKFSYHDKADIDIKFGSLGRLVHGFILYRDGNFDGEAIVLWRDFLDDDEDKKAKRKAKKKARKAKKKAKAAKRKAAKAKKKQDTTVIKAETEPKPEEKPLKQPEPEVKSEIKQASLNTKRKFGHKKNSKSKKNIFKRLKDIYNRIRAAIKNFIKTKDRIMTQVRDRENKEAVLYLILMIKKLLIHFKPKKQKFIIEFGAGEPDRTGELLGAMYAIAALMGLNLIVKPDFDNKKFEFDGVIKGRVSVFWIIVWYVKLCMNEKIYTVIDKLDII